MPAVRFTPEEIKALVDSGQLQPADVRAMHPEDRKVWLNLAAEQEKSGAEHPGLGEGSARTVAADMAANPGKAAGLAAAASVPVAMGGVIPAMGNALRYMPAMGRYAAGGAGAVIGGEGVNAIANALGLPKPIANILSMMGGMAGGHLGMGGGRPNLAAEEGFAGSKPINVGEIPDSFNGVPVDKMRASGVGPNAINKTVYATPHGPDLPQPPGFNMGIPPPEMPPNLEHVSSRAAFNDVGRTAAPATKPRFSPNEEEGAKQLEELLDATGRERPNAKGMGTFGGNPDSNLRTQPNISLKRTYEDLANTTRGGVQVEGATTDLFNKDGALDESRLKRLFEQMDAKKEPAVKPRKRTSK